MFKLVFLFVVLMAVAVTASPRPRQTQSKKAFSLQKRSPHHALDFHGRPVVRKARSHGLHAPVHHAPGGSAHHSNKVGATHGGVHSVHAGNHAGNKGIHRLVKHRAHRK